MCWWTNGLLDRGKFAPVEMVVYFKLLPGTAAGQLVNWELPLVPVEPAVAAMERVDGINFDDFRNKEVGLWGEGYLYWFGRWGFDCFCYAA